MPSIIPDSVRINLQRLEWWPQKSGQAIFARSKIYGFFAEISRISSDDRRCPGRKKRTPPRCHKGDGAGLREKRDPSLRSE